jgi:hypothetical protein
MNFNRRSYREDVLFVIALLVPAVFAGARYFESDAQMTQIAQAQHQTAEAASAAQAPTGPELVQSALAAR